MSEETCDARRILVIDDQPSIHDAFRTILDIERDCTSALDNFKLINDSLGHSEGDQPIVDLNSNLAIGFEALVRWRGEDGRLIPPNVFIGLAEETGLIVPLGNWIFEEACETLVEMNQGLELDEHVSMSINVSKRQFMDPAFVEFVSDALLKTGAKGSLVHMEITESVIMENPINIVDKLRQIHSLGVQIYMDDFGTGHSSLSCLHQFPIDILKIDQSFISRIGNDDGITAITDAIMIMAYKLGHRVVAEGIETVDQLDQLVEMGCDYGHSIQNSSTCFDHDFQGLN